MSDDGEGVRKGLLYSSTATTAHSESSVEFAAYDTEVMSMNAVSFNPSVIFS